VVKIRNVVYDRASPTTSAIRATHEGTIVLEHLNFFNKVISKLLAIDVKIGGGNAVSTF